jgi:hypothetical protein
MAVDFVDTGQGEGYATIAAHFDVSSIKFEPANDRYNATVEVIGTVYDEKGKSVDGFSQKLEMTLKPATYERVLKSGFLFTKRVKLNSGFYQVRLAIIKENSRQAGSASQWVEIADLSKKQLVLSSIFLASDKELAYLEQHQSEKIEEEKKVEDQQAIPLPVHISRRFKRDAKLDFTVFAYNPKVNEKGAIDLAIQTQLYLANKLVMATPLTPMQLPPDDKTATFSPYAARITLDKFASGTYELRLVVVDRVANKTAKRSLNFLLEP